MQRGVTVRKEINIKCILRVNDGQIKEKNKKGKVCWKINMDVKVSPKRRKVKQRFACLKNEK